MSVLTNLPIHILVAELNRRNTAMQQLKENRASLLTEIATIDRDLALLENPAPVAVAPAAKPAKAPVRPAPAKKAAVRAAKVKSPAPAPAKPAGTTTLADEVAAGMSQTKPMRADQIIAAVVKAGRKDVPKTFRSMVYTVLAKDKRFRRKGRGLYLLK